MMHGIRKHTRTFFLAVFVFALAAGFAFLAPGTARKAQAATNTLSVVKEGNYYYLSYGASEQKATGFAYVPVKITSADGTISMQKGYYYFDGNGRLTTTTVGTALRKVKVFKTTGAYTTKSLMIASGKASIQSSSVIVSSLSGYTGMSGGKVYLDGELYTGYAYYNSKLYKVANGTLGAAVTGVVTSSYVDVASKTLKSVANHYYKKGKLTTAIVNLQYYYKGAPKAKTGWVKVGTARYYLKKGVAVTGWNYLKTFSGGKGTYKYYFYKTGKLCTNLFSVNRSKYIKCKMKITVNITTHTLTFYQYDTKKKKYDIPLKSVVCATSSKRDITGNFRLEKTSAKRWFIYKKSHPYHYYQWAVHIKGTPCLIHSSQYKGTSAKKLRANIYNKLGTSCTTYCVRVQAVNAKLVYDISKKTNKKARVYVQMYKSSDKGPFGKITLSNTTGKLKSSVKIDPTDPVYYPKAGY